MEKPQKMAKNCDELSKAFSCMHANEREKKSMIQIEAMNSFQYIQHLKYFFS